MIASDELCRAATNGDYPTTRHLFFAALRADHASRWPAELDPIAKIRENSLLDAAVGGALDVVSFMVGWNRSDREHAIAAAVAETLREERAKTRAVLAAAEALVAADEDERADALADLASYFPAEV